MSTPQRLQDLHQFAQLALATDLPLPVAASADASFRSYWRVTAGSSSWIVMDAPPAHEDCRPFIDISARLVAAGLHAPQVLAQDLQQGFLLLSDLGTRTLLPELSPATVDALYADALHALLQMQMQVRTDALPIYDEARLTAELELFPTWFLQRHLGWGEDCTGFDRIELTFMRLLAAAAEQPQTFVHRDFHSRNLMVQAPGKLGILDFQDALVGPVTYDLVSLLKDCYVHWPDAQVYGWADQYRQQLAAAGMAVPGPTRWRRWFDWMGVQRHLKVLGIFARLHYRDGKSGYLADLPRVLSYVLQTCSRYGELADFGEWLEGVTRNRQLTCPRT
jgi:hypothetical protein